MYQFHANSIIVEDKLTWSGCTTLLSSLQVTSNALATNHNSQTPKHIQGSLQSFDGIFIEPKGLPQTRTQDHKIHLKLDTAHQMPDLTAGNLIFRKLRLRKLSMSCCKLESMVRPSTSSYSSPVLLVQERTIFGGCVRTTKLSTKKQSKTNFPFLSFMNSQMSYMVPGIFLKLDLGYVYHQIKMHTNAIEKIAFKTHDGHYEFLVLPFGLTNAPSTFQCLVNDVFRPYIRKFILVFFDDILIYSKHGYHFIESLRTKGSA